MAKTIKIKCNGPEGHLNLVDLDHALEESIVYRTTEQPRQNLPERLTLRCQESGCAGRIVITLPILQEVLGTDYA